MGPAGSAGLAAERHRWRVRLRDDQDRVQGAGTMLDDRHLLTCARVVERCGGPDARVKVEFAGLAGLGHAHATVEADGWRPSAGACRRASGWTSRVDSEGAGVTELARFEPQQGGEVVVEVDTGQATTRVSRRDGLVLDTKVSFERALGAVKDAASAALGQFQAMARRPDEVEIKFGVKLPAEAGAVIAKTGLDGQFEVKLKWKQPEPDAADPGE